MVSESLAANIIGGVKSLLRGKSLTLQVIFIILKPLWGLPSPEDISVLTYSLRRWTFHHVPVIKKLSYYRPWRRLRGEEV
jgi:hypothetical protein